MTQDVFDIAKVELGKQSKYDMHYNPDKLFAIPRKLKRDEIAIPAALPFSGFDIWNHYEVSWLNEKGKPIVAIAKITYSCESPCLIESKSMKLYFNSFNNTQFKNVQAVEATAKADLKKRVGAEVNVEIIPLNELSDEMISVKFDGICLDNLNVECSHYTVESTYLSVENEFVNENLYSDLLKSNCLVTHQPDWASVQIIYSGKKINHEGLLKYIVSYRNHEELHEQCIERIFMDILRHCSPEKLSVYGRFTRRGGLDINPYRTTEKQVTFQNKRLYRQ
jgi:7-cyano-7-deazaguanine reductase